MMKPIHAEAIEAVVSTLKRVAGTQAGSTRVSFVGGLAVTRLTQQHRETNDVDVFLAGHLEGRRVRSELLRGHSAFRLNFEAITGLTYKSSTLGETVKVDILDKLALRFEPRTALLSEVSSNNLPWPTRDDLISMKAVSACERCLVIKALQDVEDIKALLAFHPGPLIFPGSTMAAANKTMVRELVPQLTKLSNWSEAEWLENFGL